MSEIRTSLRAEVDRTVAALPQADGDAAAVHLARLLAQQIDDRATVARAAAKALGQAVALGDDTLIEQVEALRARLGEREALDKLGARLLAVLVELQATPKARGKVPAALPGGGKLGQLTVVAT